MLDWLGPDIVMSLGHKLSKRFGRWCFLHICYESSICTCGAKECVPVLSHSNDSFTKNLEAQELLKRVATSFWINMSLIWENTFFPIAR